MSKQVQSTERWWDIAAVIILAVILLVASSRLVRTNWTVNLSIIQILVFLGLISGLALGQSKFSPRIVFIIATIYGLFFIGWQLGSTVGADLPWLERMGVLSARLSNVVNQLIKREVVRDSILFLVLMSILFWILSLQAGYSLTRHGQAWWAILPTGLALMTIHAYDSQITNRILYLVVFLFFSLALIARVNYIHNRSRWQRNQSTLPPHLGLDFIRFTFIGAGLLIILAWTVPAMANSIPAISNASQPLKDRWYDLRDRLDDAFTSLRSTVGVVSEMYGDSAGLGRGNFLTDDLILKIKVPTDTPLGVRYYWRARTYDTYENGRWTSTRTTSEQFDPEENIIAIPPDNGRWSTTINILDYASASTLFTPSQPVWLSKPGRFEAYTNPSGTLDLSTFRAVPSLPAGQVYTVRASLSNATIPMLRQAGSQYSSWIKDRYLQLPDNITPRTRQLAEKITASSDTPYDKTVAIINYLRQSITYQETVPSLPEKQELIDWFLFDWKKGFCNYYSTAAVVLLRSVGIPARWSIGYAQGEVDNNGFFNVRQRDAHSWPEVYFPDLGWVEFEPTASQPSIVRNPGEASNNSDATVKTQQDELDEIRALMEEMNRANRGDISNLSAVGTLPTWKIILFWVLPVLLFAVLLVVIWKFREQISARTQKIPTRIESAIVRIGLKPPRFLRNWAMRTSLPPLVKSYQEINHALNRLDCAPELTATPAERANLLTRNLPPANEPALSLVKEYHLGTFSQYPANINIADSAAKQIRKLSYTARIKRFFSRFQKPEDREVIYKR